MKFIPHQTELNQGLLSWTVRHFRIHSNRAWICDTVHTHFMNLHVAAIFFKTAISYAIFRSLNSLSLFKSLVDYNALKAQVNSSHAMSFLHSPKKIFLWTLPSYPKKPFAKYETFPGYCLLRKEDVFSTIMSGLIWIPCALISSCLIHSYCAKI